MSKFPLSSSAGNCCLDQQYTLPMNAIEKLLEENPRLRYLVNTLRDYKYWWIAPALAGFAIAVCYAFLIRAESWTARQSFIIRDDLLGQSFKPGRFESQESLKSAQETILEIARRPKVIRSALERLGSPRGISANDWIDDELIEKTQGLINFNAPNGAEFGKTEVIVLTTQESTRERSRKFIEFLSEEIVSKVNEVRTRRLESMEAELIEARDGVVKHQQAALNELEALDKLLGANVSVINSLNEAQAGESSLKKEISQINNERRPIELRLTVAKATLRALMAINDQPEKIITLPSSVLRELPALEQLKKELVTKQAKLSSTLGQKTEIHPDVAEARLDVEIMKQQILDSIEGEISGTRSTIETQESQLALLDSKVQKLNSQLVTLSSKRTEHLRLTAEVKLLTESASQAQSKLSQVQSLARTARSSGLITPVDEAQVGAYPDGISKKILAALGSIGGLTLGFGLVLLVAPPMPTTDGPSDSPGTLTPAGTVAGSMARSASAIETAAGAMQNAVQAMQSLPPSRDGNRDLFEVLRTKEIETAKPKKEERQTQATSQTEAPKRSPEPTRFTPRRKTETTVKNRPKAELSPPVESVSKSEKLVEQKSRDTNPAPTPSKPVEQPLPKTARVSVPEVEIKDSSSKKPATVETVTPVASAPQLPKAQPTNEHKQLDQDLETSESEGDNLDKLAEQKVSDSSPAKLRELAQTSKNVAPVRPVDLVKSATAESFVQAQPTPLKAPPSNLPKTSTADQPKGRPVHELKTDNPFLKNKATKPTQPEPKKQVPQQETKVETSKQPTASIVRPEAPTIRQSAKTVVEDQIQQMRSGISDQTETLKSGDDEQLAKPAFPTPEKIRQLSESISRFMNKKDES